MTSKILKIKLSDLEGPLKKKLKETFPKQKIEFRLIYCGSQDGFSVVDFHQKCDNIPNTLIIVRSVEGNVFGGFTKVEWDSTYSGYKTDSSAFIFSLVNKTETPLVMECEEPEFAVFNDNSLGPVFGAGMDFAIRNNSNQNDLSSSRLGYSYKHPQYEEFSNEANSFLAGSYYFQTKEIEVFSIEN